MNSTRLMAAAIAAGLLATPVFAQTGSTTAASPGGATTPPAASPPPVTGGAAPSSAAPLAGQTPLNPGAVSGTYRPIVPSTSLNIIAELKASGEFTTLLKALDATNLTSLISSRPNLTLLAPTDAAFAALPAGELTNLMQPANAAKLQAMLTYHLINASVPLTQVQGHAAGPVPTVSGKSVTIDGSSATIKVNDANVLQAGVPAANGGLIYVIDKVLTPPA